MLKLSFKRISIIIFLTILICTVIFIFTQPTRKVMADLLEVKAWSFEIGKMLSQYAVTKGQEGNYPPSWEDLLVVNNMEMDLDELFEGCYFKNECYSWEAFYDDSLNPPIRYKITFYMPENCRVERLRNYLKMTYDHKGALEEIEREGQTGEGGMKRTDL